MSLFVCSKCGCIENTATSNYWDFEPIASALCSECDLRIGRWHGRFPKQTVEQAGMVMRNGEPITRSRAAMLDARDKLTDIPRHIGFDGVARFYFECGWDRGVSWQEQNASSKSDGRFPDPANL